MRAKLLIILLFCQVQLFCIEPGKALNFNGTNIYANLQSALADVKTISFWIRPNLDIDATSLNRQTVLMRSNDGSGSLSIESFGVFFEKANEPNAGKIVFACGSSSNIATIASNRSSWSKHQWYHVTVIVDASSGMKMYINGTLQNETAPNVRSVYFRQEGVDADLYLGKWGPNAGEYLDAQLDEMRFFTQTRSESEIRADMCRVLSNQSGIKGYLQFDVKSTNTVFSSSPGIIGGALYNATLSSYVNSSAPVGQSSTYIYSPTLDIETLSFAKNFSIKVDRIKPMPVLPTGLHIYYIYDPSLGFQLGNKGWFGVWFDSPDVDYSVELDYSALDSRCDSCSLMYNRDDQASTWSRRTAFAQSCIFDEEKENTVKYGLSQREEYTLLDTILLNLGIKDTVTGCTGDFITVSPNAFPGAVYVWDDTLSQATLNVSESGLHHVKVNFRTCTTEKDFYVKLKPIPFFELPNDTSICIGDTLWIEAPIDSAIYDWNDGGFSQRSYAITKSGLYSLTINKNGCIYTDFIRVIVKPSFQINLGRDTTLCLGQELNYNFYIPNVNFLWSDGSTSPKKTIKNQEGKFWLKAWNDCFTRIDTVNVLYKECDCHIYIPNSFTPNGDGFNDVFFPVSGCFYEEFELDITDRWGNTIFRTTDINQGWDGTANGTKAQEGVYTYRVRYKKYTWLSKTKYQHGVITLFN